MIDSSPILTWQVRFSLFTNPNIVKSWLKAMGITYGLCMLILIPVFIATGELNTIPMIVVIFAGIIAGISLLGFFVMLIILGNRSHARFTLTDKQVEYESLDQKIKGLSRASVIAGGIFGSPGTAGAGLISIGRESVRIDWKAITSAHYDDKHATICLKNSFRELLHLYCTPENFQSVKAFVASRLIPETNKCREKTVLTFSKKEAFYQTVLVVIFSMAFFALNDITRLDIFPVLLFMLFGLAMVWMIPFFGFVILCVNGYLIFHIVTSLFKTSNLKLVSTYTYRKYELLDFGELIILGLCVVGIFYYSWLSIEYITGKRASILMKH